MNDEELRDWFVGKMISGAIGDITAENVTEKELADAAKLCYRLADALLAARRSNTQEPARDSHQTTDDKQ